MVLAVAFFDFLEETVQLLIIYVNLMKTIQMTRGSCCIVFSHNIYRVAKIIWHGRLGSMALI